MLNVVMLSVAILSAVMLNIVAPNFTVKNMLLGRHDIQHNDIRLKVIIPIVVALLLVVFNLKLVICNLQHVNYGFQLVNYNSKLVNLKLYFEIWEREKNYVKNMSNIMCPSKIRRTRQILFLQKSRKNVQSPKCHSKKCRCKDMF